MEEQWSQIKDFEGWYEVSTQARVRSVDRIIHHKSDRFTDKGKVQINNGKVLTPQQNNKGYFYIMLYKNCVHKKKYIHRLVAEAFIPNPECKKEVNHIDGNHQNNKIENLEWCTKMENMTHAFQSNLVKTKKPVMSTDLITKEVTIYESVSSAGRARGISHTGISLQLKRKIKSCDGCVWDYL